MSVRVVARIRPLSKTEAEKDQILSIHNGSDQKPQIVKIPNPKNFSEEYGFHFNSVYDHEATQQQIFEAEVSPTLKHLFQGFDVTLFAYGVTGTGKTHTMRGGKTLVDRGMIPRMLSNIYRKSKALEKASDGETNVQVSMSYYEIYNDKVFDLFEAPEKRTPTGLPIREAEGGKTVVVGLTELPCSNLKDFEVLYDKANSNRSVGSTKLNAHSSRSHAILCVKVTISTPTETRSSTVCAIDLAGSEDNRRTGNNKDRMVESASINKSLFVLAQCVEAISKKQTRIPYRESKMTRILSLGQNNGLTVMILNLAPSKAFHLDTLSSLNFANRTKKIEVREVENEPIFKGPPRQPNPHNSDVKRQPLRPLTNASNANILANREVKNDKEKPAKLFSVYSDKTKSLARPQIQKSSPLKRPAQDTLSARPLKQRPTDMTSMLRKGPPGTSTITKATLESLVEQKVAEILAARDAANPQPQHIPKVEPAISAEVQARLDSIEKRLEGQDGERAEGLSYLFMAKQHQARGENSSALRMYELAQPFFPGNEKLQRKIEKLRSKLGVNGDQEPDDVQQDDDHEPHPPARRRKYHLNHDSDYEEANSDNDSPRPIKRQRKPSPPHFDDADTDSPPTPRTSHLLSILNTRNTTQLQALPGLGSKKAEAIVEYLNAQDSAVLGGWRDVLGLEVRGIGRKTWEGVREGVSV